MADLVADELGHRNDITRAQAVRDARTKLDQRDRYLADVLAAGTPVSLTVPRGAAENSTETRAVIQAGDENINRQLIQQGYGTFREDLGGAEEQAMHGRFGRLMGSYAEEMFFEGDQSRLKRGPCTRVRMTMFSDRSPNS